MKRTLIVLIALMMLLPMGQIAGATSWGYCIHDLVEVLENTEPTCNAAGIYRFRCLECGFEDYYVTPSIPHDYEDVKVYEKATCVSQGDAAVRCKMCDQRTRIWKPIDPNAHEWREVSKTPSTCTTAGTGSYICNLCGKTEDRKLPKGSHSYGEIGRAHV